MINIDSTKIIENEYVHLKTQLIFGFDIQLGHCFIRRDEEDQVYFQTMSIHILEFYIQFGHRFILFSSVDPYWSFI